MISPVFYALLAEVLIIVIVAVILKGKMTLEGVVSNGTLVTMFAATLLFDQKAIGFLVLVYAIFLIAAGVKEYTIQKLGKQTSFGELFDKALEILGHYYFVLALLLVVLVWVYLFGG